MPPAKTKTSQQTLPLEQQVARTLEDVASAVGEYSIDAYHFIQEGIQYAADRVHGPLLDYTAMPDGSRHISGQQLCEGLRDFALERWGLMARAVLAMWGVYKTIDFGQIVFAMIDAGLFQKQPSDSLDDFRDVYDFRQAFDASYKIRLPETIE